MREVSSALISTSDLDTMLQLVTDKVAHVLETRWVFILLFDHEKRVISKIVLGGDHPQEVNTDHYTWQEAMDGLSGWVVENRITALSPKGTLDVRESGEVRLRRSVNHCGAIIVSPLMVEDKVYGTLTAINRDDEGDFDETDAEIITVLANQASSVLASRQAADRMAQLSREKELLLREAYHRIKNNLNMVSGIINLQRNQAEGFEAKQHLQLLESRIQAIALIHSDLYQTDNHEEVEGRFFLSRLVRGLQDSYDTVLREGSIHLHVTLEEGKFSFSTALSVGLILNELVTNALKYAYPPESGGGEIRISLKRFEPGETGPEAHLQIEDDGVGIPGEMTPADKGSLGISLVEGMTQKLEGTYSLKGQGGVSWSLRWPEEDA